ncbi:MAG: hypothetical protein AAF433_18085 [Bacteroidota bacterium]
MRHLPFLLLLFFACQSTTPESEEEEETVVAEFSFLSSDSVTLFGDLYLADKSAATILLFHQGGSNARGEYGPIIPRLRADGFNVLTIDQRVGGQIYGSFNRTLANIPSYSFGDAYTYCDAYTNLEGALDYLLEEGFTGPKVIWGSSYSGTLAIQLAAKRSSDLAAVLAFSPASGGPLQACLADPYLEELPIPLLLLRPLSEMENERAVQQMQQAQAAGHQTYIADHGVHGSSMLVADRVGQAVEDNWAVVIGFIREMLD